MPRWLELCLAILLLILISPLMLIVAVLIYLLLGRPLLFVQQRPGLFAKPFNLYKFRTMSVGEAGDEQRLTRFGALLRKFSLDELPQLFNVILGHLSFVGPRPLLMEYLALYTPDQARRHLVKPGITGWAQVNGRNALEWEDKFKLDVWYVDNKSFSLDLKILCLTVIKVLSARDIGYNGQITTHKFTGGVKGTQQ